MGDGLVNGFGGTSIGLHGLAMVFKGSQPLAKSFVSEGFNGWMATIGANGMTLVFGETTIGLNGIGMVFNCSHNEPSARSSPHFQITQVLNNNIDPKLFRPRHALNSSLSNIDLVDATFRR